MEEEKRAEIIIADAIQEDIHGIRNVQKISWLATYPNSEYEITYEDIENKFAQDTAEQWKQRIQENSNYFNIPNKHTFVAKNNNNEIIGFCVVTKEEDAGHINTFYVLPNYQRRNIGKQLMDRALSWLGSDKDISINVASYNETAIKFYERFGFEKSDNDIKDPEAILPSGKVIPVIEMVKKHR
ncbi:MAG: GNAT family N-acetyltransferase [Patescibacteria group bacterium]|nr:GNAT family N-acetyltransferase [Patescibacteria group bacterium]